MKPLVGLPVMGRPKTTRKVLEALFSHSNRSDYDLVVVDQASGPEMQEVLNDFRTEIDEIYRFDYNIGLVFAVNYWMLKRKPGQNCIRLDDDCIIVVPNWLELMMTVAKDSGVGNICGRRPSFWSGSQGRFEYFKNLVHIGTVNGIPVEFIDPTGLVGPFWMVTDELLQKIGYVNEVTCEDETDFTIRSYLAGFTACYVPDAVILQPQDEIPIKPKVHMNRLLVQKNKDKVLDFYAGYRSPERKIYLGTRFLPKTCSPEYLKQSEENWRLCESFKDK